MAWIYLLLAGVFEIVWATAMKESAGFTRLWPSLVTLLFMILSFGLLAVSMKTLPLGTAYTIWVGIGAVGAFALGILLGESPSPLRLLAVGLIVAGIVILKLATRQG
ncbi:multidrug efflux SMR transporter [Pseudomonas aeruginosa]|nr:multidrug efflux SMR transporter [Pseudomonas aeruginosa]